MLIDERKGGPAFPQDNDATGSAGMTLRDYFAAHAPFTMQDASRVWAEHGEGTKPTGRELMSALAGMRIAYADAMIAERAK